MDEDQNRRDFAIALCLLVAFGAALFALPARAGSALILVCNLEEKVCTATTARISLHIPVESPLPSACAYTAQQKLAEMPHLVAADEYPRISCTR